jgi:hypothetical protein
LFQRQFIILNLFPSEQLYKSFCATRGQQILKAVTRECGAATTGNERVLWRNGWELVGFVPANDGSHALYRIRSSIAEKQGKKLKEQTDKHKPEPIKLQ